MAFCRMTLPKSPLSTRQEIVRGEMIIKKSTNHTLQRFARNTLEDPLFNRGLAKLKVNGNLYGIVGYHSHSTT